MDEIMLKNCFMRPRFEKVLQRAEESFTMLNDSAARFDAPMHYHPEIELTHIVSSRGRRLIGDHIGQFKAGDLVLIGENLPHAYYNDTPRRSEKAESRVVQFRRDAFGEDFFDLAEMRRLNRLLERARRGLWIHGRLRTRVLARMDELYQARGARRITCLLEVLTTMAGGRELEPLASPGYTPTLTLYQGDRINRVCEYIHAKFDQPLTQTEVAAHAHMSPPAFSRFFHKITSRTFTAFLNEVRIGHACRLLTETDRSVLDICYASGFGNLSNFNRRFRQLRGTTPREYRQAILRGERREAG